MIVQYIQKAMEQAHYEIIDDDEPYYGEIPACPGVWATGRALGFEGPFAGGQHPYMVRGDLVLTVPNPHRGEIGPTCLPVY